MFIGHYGVSLAAKRYEQRLPLGVLFAAVQVLDLLFTGFVIFGIEKMRIVPGFTAYNPYDLYFMPYTHSLAGALGWSALSGLVCWKILRKGRDWRLRAGVIVGLAVFSHYLLDLPMHTPDMPLLPDESSMKLGMGLWNYRYWSLLAEGTCFVLGAVSYLKATKARPGSPGILTASVLSFMGVLLVATPFMPPPPGATAFSVQALLAYIFLAVLAERMDRSRLPA